MMRIKDTESGSTPQGAIEAFKRTEGEDPLPTDLVLRYAGTNPGKQGLHAVASKTLPTQHYEADWEVAGTVRDFTRQRKPGPLPDSCRENPSPSDAEGRS